MELKNIFSNNEYPLIHQLDSQDCGPSCVRSILMYYGKELTQQQLVNRAGLSREGITLGGLGRLAEKVGFRSLSVKISFERLRQQALLPAIALWNQNHFVVVWEVTKKHVIVSDPSLGRMRYSHQEFKKGWAQGLKDGEEAGVLLMLEPLPELFDAEKDAEEASRENKARLGFLSKYLRRYKAHILQLCLGLFIGAILQMTLPFLTRSIVDYGIQARDVGFIWLILIGQLVLYLSMTTVEFIRAWLLIHVSSRVNVFILSDFLMKLMRLPMRFFDSRVTGDLIQRIRDHERVEDFMTNTLLQSLFSVFSAAVLLSILAFFDVVVFAIFLVSFIAEMVWIRAFMKKLREYDDKNFALMSQDQEKTIELVNGMQEIKLHNVEQLKRWEWEGIQAKLFRVNLGRLKLDQVHGGGQRFFNYMQTVLITFVSAMAVVNGTMTLGTMMAIIFILGQINAAVTQMINFILQGQRAAISLERLGEVHGREDEEIASQKQWELPQEQGGSIAIENLSFGYSDLPQHRVLKDINMVIPEGKITAIVGMSGSGKTTLVKLLLKFYAAQEGNIQVGQTPLDDLSSSYWRGLCGSVMQESFIFNDTIASNIAMEENIDEERLLWAADIANIKDFVLKKPMGFESKVGADGVGLSKGQKQRLLIARAVYKDPKYLFFDEATNSLDAKNELVIMRNLEQFFQNRTVVIVAHRLSTVKNADQIVVLDQGEIVEYGHHEFLIGQKSMYYELIKNQLELGN